MKKGIFAIVMWLTACAAGATKYYISPTGDDSYEGVSKRKAMATLQAVQEKVKAGDIVYIMPGKYVIAADTEADVIFEMSKSGTQGSPISYIGMVEDGDCPVFDFSEVSAEKKVTAFRVTGSYLLFQNFEVIGLKGKGFYIEGGSHNTFENIACHDGTAVSFTLTGTADYQLITNCDSYNNDNGFVCQVDAGCSNNLLIGCRAWNNQNDAFDLTNCFAPVTICYSIAYWNGYDAENTSSGDGHGFKMGGFGMEQEITMSEIPMHQIYQNIAASNRGNGFYSNDHVGGLFVKENTAYRNNSYNFNFANRKGMALEDAVEVNGYSHQIVKNLSMVSDGKTNHVTKLRGDEGENSLEENSFEWVAKNSGGWSYKSYGNSIFESTTVANFIIARNEDGTLADDTQAVMHQNVYQGQGCDFSGYAAALTDAKTKAGATAGGETGIQHIRATRPVDDAIYDLMGRKVERPSKGIYIIDNKKVIIK